jgi:hypothetical protein
VRGLTGIEDSEPNTPQYWLIWGLFAERVRKAKWVTHLNDEYSMGDEMMAAIFVGAFWRDDVRHWKSLEGYGHLVDELFESLPPSSTVLDDYVRYLFHVGERSSPAAFVRIVRVLNQGGAQALLTGKQNTIFHLEVLLQRYIYGRPLELKRDSVVREAVLALLDLLVECGSSASFRMRDDFVTPLPAEPAPPGK